MSGIPGSGKSTCAKTLKDWHDTPNSVICSADDYFMVNGVYKFDAADLFHAHKWCQSKFKQALEDGTEVIIVDNTNVNYQQIKTYYDMFTDAQYLYEHSSINMVRPDTSWCFDAEECFKRNAHSVPLEVIKKMLNEIKNTSYQEMKIGVIYMQKEDYEQK